MENGKNCFTWIFIFICSVFFFIFGKNENETSGVNCKHSASPNSIKCSSTFLSMQKLHFETLILLRVSEGGDFQNRLLLKKSGKALTQLYFTIYFIERRNNFIPSLE